MRPPPARPAPEDTRPAGPARQMLEARPVLEDSTATGRRRSLPQRVRHLTGRVDDPWADPLRYRVREHHHTHAALDPRHTHQRRRSATRTRFEFAMGEGEGGFGHRLRPGGKDRPARCPAVEGMAEAARYATW